MNFSFDHTRTQIFMFLFYCFIAAIALAPLASNTLGTDSPDFFNHLASIIQAKMALVERQFPIRDEIAGDGFRYPLFQFYSPTSYTFAALLYKWLTPSSPYLAYKLSTWIALILGGIYMQRLAYWLLKSTSAAMLTSVLYLMAPYYLIVNIHLYGFNEGLAMGVLPVVLYYTFLCYSSAPSLKNLIFTSLAWYLLITIHLITFVYTAFFVSILLILNTFKNFNHVKNLIFTGAAFAVACLLCMWFLGPISLFSDFFRINTSFNNSSDFYTNSASLLGLLSFTANYIFTADPHHFAGIIPAAGWLLLTGSGLCAYAFLNKHKIKSARANLWQPSLLIVFFIAFFMVWSPINIWQWLPHALMVGQYSWRILAQVSWMGALLSGWTICYLTNDQLNKQHILLGTLLIIITVSSWFPIIDKESIIIPDNFIKNPKLIFNATSYLLDVEKNSQFIDIIDNVVLENLKTNNALNLNTPFIMTRALLKFGDKPYVSLQGSFPETVTKSQQLHALLNNKVIAVHALHPGNFNWDIPINIKNYVQTTFSLQFKFVDNAKQKNSTPPVISINDIILTGFLSPTKALKIETVNKHCTTQKNITICTLDVPASIKLIELPIHYYPNLWRITLNGKKIPYKGIIRFGAALTAITPDPGKINLIKIQFQGLDWANKISRVSWSGLLLLIFYFLIKRDKTSS